MQDIHMLWKVAEKEQNLWKQIPGRYLKGLPNSSKYSSYKNLEPNMLWNDQAPAHYVG
jgi:hypothetical protein